MEENLSLFQEIGMEFACPKVSAESYSPLVLAYIGDGIYELVIRTIIISRGNRPVQKLHSMSSSLVKASAQCRMIMGLMERLSEQELAVYKRGRNTQSGTTAKNASVSEYRKATGFEALIGWLYITGQKQRMYELIREGLQLIDAFPG